MEGLLKWKSWQIFLLMSAGLVMINFTIENDTFSTTLIRIVGMFIYLLYPFSLGLFLHEYLPSKIELKNNFFLFNFFVWVLAYAIIQIMSEGKGKVFTGMASLPVLYVFYAFINLLAFPMRLLKSIEIDSKARFVDYVGEFFLLLIAPIGIWIIQPRIVNIAKNKEMNEKE